MRREPQPADQLQESADSEMLEEIEERFKNFFELSEEEEGSLREKVEQSRGLVRIFVHPYFVEHEKEWNEESKKKLLSIDRALRILALTDSEKSPPVLCMEESGKMGELKQRLKTPDYQEGFSGEVKNDVYIIPTAKSDPLPVFDDSRRIRSDYSEQEEAENWKRLTLQLKKMGVKKVLVGGMFLDFFGPEKEGDTDAWGCVGRTIELLEKDFKVQLSNLTYSERGLEEDYEPKRKKLRKKFK